LNACALCGRAFSPKTGLFNLFSGTSPTVRGLTAPVAVDLRTGFRLLIAELRKSAVNNRKSSFKDDRNRDWLSNRNVEELKNTPQLQTHPSTPIDERIPFDTIQCSIRCKRCSPLHNFLLWPQNRTFQIHRTSSPNSAPIDSETA